MTKRIAPLFVGILIIAAALTNAHAQISTPQQQAEQDALDAKTPKLNYTEEVLQLLIPDYTMGQTVGADVNSANHIFVYSRTNPQGITRGGAAQCCGSSNRAASSSRNGARTITRRLSPTQSGSIRTTTCGRSMKAPAWWSSTIPKACRSNNSGGRSKQSTTWKIRAKSRAAALKTVPAGKPCPQLLKISVRRYTRMATSALSIRPTDVAWDSAGNVFVIDGYGNSRLVKIAPGGHWLKWVGTNGTGPDQFNIVHSVAVDRNDNVYAANRNNHRIQVYDDNLNFKKSITGMGAPWGLCIPKPDATGKQYIFSSDGTSGRLYKIDYDSGKVVGWAQTSLGRGEDDAGRLIHEIGCKDPNVVYLGSAILWNVTKVTIK